MTEEIREEIKAKIKWLEWNNHPRALELIEWLNYLLQKTEEVKAPVKKEIKVEIPEAVEEAAEEEVVEEKKAPKRKIIFKKK